MVEEWKSVINYEGLYEVSSQGKVKSFVLYSTGRLLKPCPNARGYPLVVLSKNGLKKKNHHVHRLVAEAFIDRPEGKDTVNHINGIKIDNNKENLEWVTQSENVRHGYAVLGVKPNKPWLGKTGFDNPSSKSVTIRTIEGIERLFGSTMECSRQIGISCAIVHRVLKYKELPYTITKGKFKGLTVLSS